MLSSFKQKIDSQKISGDQAAGLNKYFENRANLTDEENQILQEVAFEFSHQIAPIDAQARTIIAQARQVPANGEVSQSKIPPAELISLQEQRNQLVLQYRDTLKDRLGTDGFTKFDEYVKTDFASRLQAIPLSSVDFSQPQP